MSSPSTPTSAQQHAPAFGLTFLVIGIFAYGGLWPVMRIAVDYIPPFWFATTRVFIGSLVMFAYLASTGRLKLPTRADWPAILSVGICMMGIYVSMVHYAVQFVPAGRGALLGYSTPLWVTPVAVLFLGEKLTVMRAFGLVFGLFGLGILFNPTAFDWSDPDVLLGNGLCVLAAMSWSVAILQMRSHKWNLTPLQLGPWQLLVATLVTLPFSIMLEEQTNLEIGLPLFALIAYGGLIGTALAMWAVASSIRYLGAVTTSVGMLGGPVVAITVSVLFLGEVMTLTLGGGLALILGGIVLISIAQARLNR